MPALSFHLPEFLRFHRSHSRSPKSPPPVPCHGATAPNVSLPSSSHPSSGFGVPKQGANAAINTSHLSAPSNSLLDKASHNSRGQPFQASRPTPLISAAASNTTQMLCPQDSIAIQPAVQLSFALERTNSVLSQVSPGQLLSPRSLTMPCGKSLDANHLPQSSSQYFPRPIYQAQGMFNQPHDITLTGSTFIDGDVNITTSNQFMEKLLEKTIPGAAFDSSARYPPPRCHPGTRLAILERCLCFITNCDGVNKVRWVVGAAGVGKSAIMQSIAESPNLPATCYASVFFSVIGRNDGTKAVLTLSYQFAAKSEVYRRLIENEVARNPSLLQSSIPVQFNKFIVEPFIHYPQLNSLGRVLIIIDGLDECAGPRIQQELLHLIWKLCTQYPSSPIVWIIASRPEPHITSFFSRHDVVPAYAKEEVPINSDQAQVDVEQYLRHELTEIKEAFDSLDPQWPDERDLWKLANAAGGLFAYAHTAVGYIGDLAIANPASQLSDVLNVIDRHPMINVPPEEHPLALLDALYARILSNLAPKSVINAQKLLLALASDWDEHLILSYPVGNLILLCNWLGMTPEEAYSAFNHLCSVLCVPRRDKAHEEVLRPFHKSFIDYISDFTRSGFSSDLKHEAQQIKTKCAFRILNEAPDGINISNIEYSAYYGTLARGPGTRNNILLTWLDDGDDRSHDIMRFIMYKLAIAEVVAGVARGDPSFQIAFCSQLLATGFRSYDIIFPRYQFRDLVFAESQRNECMMQGVLKQMSLGVVGTVDPRYLVKLEFRRPATTATSLPDPWDPSCEHKRKGEWDEGTGQKWVTNFWPDDCVHCSYQLELHLARMKARFSDCIIPTLVTATGDCCAEFRFVNEEDGISEWRYWFWIILIEET